MFAKSACGFGPARDLLSLLRFSIPIHVFQLFHLPFLHPVHKILKSFLMRNGVTKVFPAHLGVFLHHRVSTVSFKSLVMNSSSEKATVCISIDFCHQLLKTSGRIKWAILGESMRRSSVYKFISSKMEQLSPFLVHSSRYR